MEKFRSKIERSTTEIFQDCLSEISEVSILEKDKDKVGNLLAPNGKISNLLHERTQHHFIDNSYSEKGDDLLWKLVRTPSFIKWFGNWLEGKSSGLLDENGEPLIFYHGLENSERYFSVDSLPKSKDFKSLGDGLYFTPYLDVAARHGSSIQKVFINTREYQTIKGIEGSETHKGISISDKVKDFFIDKNNTSTYSTYSHVGIYDKYIPYEQVVLRNDRHYMILPLSINSESKQFINNQ